MKLLLLAISLAVGFATSPAYACSLSPCFLQVFPSSGALPANMVQLRFTDGPKYIGDGSAAPRLYRVDGAAKVLVPYQQEPINTQQSWLEPIESLPVGTALLFEAELSSSCKDGSSLTATYTIAAATPVPTTLGELAPQYGRGRIAVASGAPCSEEIDAAYADVRVEPTTEAAPYAALFAYETYVDGKPQAPFRSSLGDFNGRPQGEDRIYAVCGGNGGGLGEGKHRVRFVGSLPNGTKVETPEIEIDLRCKDGCALASGGGFVCPSSDAGVPDADATPNGGRKDGDRDAMPLSGGVDSGIQAQEADGCALASGRSGLSGGLLALAFLLPGWRRRLGG